MVEGGDEDGGRMTTQPGRFTVKCFTVTGEYTGRRFTEPGTVGETLTTSASRTPSQSASLTVGLKTDTENAVDDRGKKKRRLEERTRSKTAHCNAEVEPSTTGIHCSTGTGQDYSGMFVRSSHL